MRKLTIGIASYGNPEKLAATIESIRRNTVSDYRLLIWNNWHPDVAIQMRCFEVIKRDTEGLDCLLHNPTGPNVGYAGAVNGLLAACDTDYFVYCDNDVEIRTPGWDEKLCEVLDAYPEVAQVFPGAGHYGFHNGRYHECLWNAGYCWGLRMSAATKIEKVPNILPYSHMWVMDESLGHHNEVDLQTRLRFSGYTIAARPDVDVFHHESSTRSPESEDRIHKGVVEWMNRWNRYFVGDQIKYPNPEKSSGEGYDPRTLRYTDWNIHQLFLERMTLHYFPDWNSNPRTVEVPGVGKMDVIEVLKPHGFYKGRAL